MSSYKVVLRDYGTSFDITHLIKVLGQRKSTTAKAAGSALKELRDAISATNDFILSYELVESLKRDLAKKSPEFPVSIMVATFSQAILLYVRGSEKGSQRKSLKIYNHLSDKQKDDHDKFKRLRSKAIAHLDDDRSYGDRNFLDQRLVLIHRNAGHTIQLAEMRMAYQWQMINELESNLSTALTIAKAALRLAEKKAGDTVSALSKESDEIADLIEKYPFDAQAFFGDDKIAEAFLEGGIGPDVDRAIASFSNWPEPDRGISNKTND